jgi:glycosyltransferase involved in cell wall biosynthesis
MLWHANVLGAAALRGRPAILVGGKRVSEPRRWRWPVERWAVRRMARMVCVSEDVRRHALDQDHLPAEKLVVIPNGVRLRQLDANQPCRWGELGVENAEHILLFVGRLEPQKGVLELARHAPQLLKDLAGWSLVLMGKGSLQSPIESVLHNQTMTDRVRLVGWRPRADHWMAASDVLLLPAEYEGMPNVLLEAMAMGRPFVAFSVDGVAQLLAGRYPSELARAQLASPGNWNEFVDRARSLAADMQLRQACSQANRTQVAELFRLEDQLDKYEALYEALCAVER